MNKIGMSIGLSLVLCGMSNLFAIDFGSTAVVSIKNATQHNAKAIISGKKFAKEELIIKPGATANTPRTIKANLPTDIVVLIKEKGMTEYPNQAKETDKRLVLTMQDNDDGLFGDFVIEAKEGPIAYSHTFKAKKGAVIKEDTKDGGLAIDDDIVAAPEDEKEVGECKLSVKNETKSSVKVVALGGSVKKAKFEVVSESKEKILIEEKEGCPTDVVILVKEEGMKDFPDPDKKENARLVLHEHSDKGLSGVFTITPTSAPMVYELKFTALKEEAVVEEPEEEDETSEIRPLPGTDEDEDGDEAAVDDDDDDDESKDDDDEGLTDIFPLSGKGKTVKKVPTSKKSIPSKKIYGV